MPKALSPHAVAAWERTGILFPHPVMSKMDARAVVAKLEDSEARCGRSIDGAHAHRCHVLLPWVNQIIRLPAILDAVEDLIGPDILCWNSHLFMKSPGDRRFVSWHQDLTYFGLDTTELVTVWIALTPATPLSGCVRVVPGSHRAQQAHEDTFAPDNMLTRGQRLACAPDERKALMVELRPGEASFHHGLLVHASGPNCSTRRRIGLAIRYVPTRARQVVGHRDWATLVRGQDAFGNFAQDHVPLSDMEPEAVAFHAAAAAAQAEILYQGLFEPRPITAPAPADLE